jgi:hypothetical protein
MCSYVLNNFDCKIKLIVLCAMKLYGGAEVLPHGFLTSAFDVVCCQSVTLVVGKGRQYSLCGFRNRSGSHAEKCSVTLL